MASVLITMLMNRANKNANHRRPTSVLLSSLVPKHVEDKTEPLCLISPGMDFVLLLSFIITSFQGLWHRWVCTGPWLKFTQSKVKVLMLSSTKHELSWTWMEKFFLVCKIELIKGTDVMYRCDVHEFSPDWVDGRRDLRSGRVPAGEKRPSWS